VGMDSHIVGMHFHILGAPVGGHGFSDLLSVVCFSVILRPLVRCLGRSRRCCAMLYSGASIWECIPIYWDAHIYMGMHSHILGDPVSGNAFQDTGVPQGPRVNWNAFSYIGIPQYLGMHSHTPGTPVYGNALPYSRASQYMRMHSHIRGYPCKRRRRRRRRRGGKRNGIAPLIFAHGFGGRRRPLRPQRQVVKGDCRGLGTGDRSR
jgi:hypothetical protein